MQPERRTRKRRYVMFYSRVYDRDTGEVLGQLVDLTTDGIMIISDKYIASDIVFHLQLELPEDISPRQFLRFDAQSVWCRQDIVPRFFDSGFKLIDVPEQDVAILERMVDTYGFRDL
jgi:hypothetical protein